MEWDGAQGRNRTTDTAIFSRMLYQLSYLGTSTTPGLKPARSRLGRPLIMEMPDTVQHAENDEKPIAFRCLTVGLGRSALVLAIAAAVLRTQGLAGFCEVVGVASRWFDAFPDKLYPLVDEDAILRRSVLNCLADRMAIVEAVRRQPLVSNQQLGVFSLRHFEIASGAQTPTESDGEPPSASHVSAALAAAADDQIGPLAASLAAAVAVPGPGPAARPSPCRHRSAR